MKTSAPGSGLESFGDPDPETPVLGQDDFAEEHEQFVVGESEDEEKESGRYAGGLDDDGPP